MDEQEFYQLLDKNGIADGCFGRAECDHAGPVLGANGKKRRMMQPEFVPE